MKVAEAACVAKAMEQAMTIVSVRLQSIRIDVFTPFA
jgi:hypothetical protein